MSDAYSEFLAGKLADAKPCGFDAPRIGGALFPFQRELTRWALQRGRAAIFASTGLGKTRMQLAWASAVNRETKWPVLILAPLAVAQQTVHEGAEVGVKVALCREAADVQHGVNITNYERIHRFDASVFRGVVLDESSCIKHFNSKTLSQLVAAFGQTPYRLCATATPAPNDYTELGTHAEFLGVCTREEMLAEFFCHDGGETQVWRLKGHAQRKFWSWVSSWGALVRTPADLGHDASAYALPPLDIRQHTIESSNAEIHAATGELFAGGSQSLMERRAARKSSLPARVAECAGLVNASKESWVIWCDLNAEADALREAIPEAVEVRGSDDIDEKEQRLNDFAAGKIRILITKSSIAGFGLNWQHCARMAFVGVNDSWESYFQAIRRCWRFGQTRPVEVHVFASELEGAVVQNLERKGLDAESMGEALAKETAVAVREVTMGQRRLTSNQNHGEQFRAPSFLVTRGA